MRALTAIRRRLTFANVMSAFAVFLVLTTGTAYAAATITGADIVNGSIGQADIAPNSLGTNVIKTNGVKSVDIRDGEVASIDILDGTISAADLANNSVGSTEIATDAVGATEIADNTIDSGEVIDFGLSNQDIGVLFAQVSDTGAVSNSSGNVTVIDDPVGPGTSAVDFGRNVSGCGAVVTQGEAGSGGAAGAITGVSDRSGNAEAFFVTTRNNANVLVNTAYQIMVVC